MQTMTWVLWIIGLLALAAAIILLLSRRFSLTRFLRTYWNVLRRSLPLALLLLGALLITWAAAFFFAAQPLYVWLVFAAILAVLILAGWFAIRDFISGAILKAEDLFEVDSWVKINNVEGRIRRAGYRVLDIETQNDERVSIPYSRLSRELLIRSGHVEPSQSHTFKLDVPREVPVTGMVQQIRTAALNAVWSSTRREPQIVLSDENHQHYIYEVTVYALDNEYFSTIESAVRQTLAAHTK